MAERIVIDPELWDLIPEYLNRRRDDVAALRDALERMNFAVLDEIGHRLRGSGASYGFARISELGRSMERAASDQDASGLRAQIEDLASHLEALEPVRG